MASARSIEALQDAARQYNVSLYAAVPYVAGKAGSSLSTFVKLIEGARFETQNLPLPEMVQVVLELSTLLAHYQTEKEGADRIENLEQLVSAATLFISEEDLDMRPRLSRTCVGASPSQLLTRMA